MTPANRRHVLVDPALRIADSPREVHRSVERPTPSRPDASVVLELVAAPDQQRV
jgi:hypothetical protein